MSIEENKALVRRFCELENRGEVDALFELLDPGYVSHYTTGDVPLDKQFWATFHTAFPDISFTMEHMVAEGDLVAVFYTLTGTFKGEMAGMAPTGKQMALPYAVLARFENGNQVEAWPYTDSLTMYQQLDISPPGQ